MVAFSLRYDWQSICCQYPSYTLAFEAAIQGVKRFFCLCWKNQIAESKTDAG